MTTEIKPCAFCGEYDGECAISGVPNHQGKQKFAVYCNGCFSEGPPAETKEEAIEAWNTRSPTPAASGAAPAEFDPWLRTICITAPPPQAYDLAKQAWAQGMKRGAALASREASSATLTDERIVELWVEHGLDELDPEAFARVIEREVRAALASPQVAPESDPHLWNVVKELREKGMGDLADRLELSSQAFVEDVYEQCAEAIRPLVDRGLLPGSVVESVQIMAANFALATPVQVAPTGWKWVPVEPTADMLNDQNHDVGARTARKTWSVMVAAAPAPVAPQDDARDAAEVLTDEQLDAIAVERYTVVPNPDKVFGYAVHAGNGRGACYRGHRTECESVAARMRTAFLDGAYVARHPESVLSTPAAKPTEPTLPTQGDAKVSSLDAQIKGAQAEVASWSPEKRKSLRLQGGEA